MSCDETDIGTRPPSWVPAAVLVLVVAMCGPWFSLYRRDYEEGLWGALNASR